ncbi:hypothetical protein EVAR_37146_1 [Eumeta japonica]|uniref:Uncharacterized protein n=1 Tax=Eumeta variegata TaxID=151549 RepID=A0A4C1WL10_EUMVA|nr:hypothetical protein EVAR_37146_1 [Eumeta japonica]
MRHINAIALVCRINKRCASACVSFIKQERFAAPPPDGLDSLSRGVWNPLVPAQAALPPARGALGGHRIPRGRRMVLIIPLLEYAAVRAPQFLNRICVEEPPLGEKWPLIPIALDAIAMPSIAKREAGRCSNAGQLTSDYGGPVRPRARR